MFGVHRRFQGGLGLGGARLGAAVGVPVIPAGSVHERFGENRGNIRVIGILVVQLAHGIHVGEVTLAVVGDGVLVVEHEQRVDQLPLSGGAVVGQFQRGADGLGADAVGVIGHAAIAAVGIRAGGVGQSPVGHGVVRLQARGFLIRGDGLRKIKAPGHAQTLVKKRPGPGGCPARWGGSRCRHRES